MTPKELKDCLVEVIGDDLGQYKRPGLPDIPAFWVWDRPLPADYAVITALPTEPMIPAIEGILDPNSVPRKRTRNTRHLTLDRVWSLTLVGHDRRQLFDSVVDRMLCHFSQLDEPTYLAGSDLYNPQYQFFIPFLTTMEVS